MKDISHKQAVKLIHLRLDGLLNESQKRSLDEHLVSCDSCRAYSAEMDMMPARLRNEIQSRWDRNPGPSHRVLEHVTTRARKIPMTNRISSSIRLMASAFLVAFLILGINFVILQMKSNPIKTIGTQSVSGSELSNNRLIAFTSEKDGNFEIYTMSADGSNLTNLTNDPAQDIHPVWSPDGKHIVFESDRAGNKQIYLMNSDGSNIVQLTHDEVDHQLPVIDDSRHSIWSPDGNKILFLQNDQDGKTWTLNSININGENKTTLVSDTRQFDTASWSPTGDFIGLVLFDELKPDGLLPNIYVIDADGNNLREVQKFLPQEEHIFVPYFWSSNGQSVIFPAHKLNPERQIIYEFRLSDNALTTVTAINPMLFDWYDGIALITDFNIENQPLVWLRPDGTTTTLDYLKGANPADCYIDKERSLRGNLAIGSYCKQDDKVLLYWTNRDGSTIQQLPDLEVPVVNGGLGTLTLSPDEKFVTFNFESEDETNLYIWNVEEALTDSSIQPIRMVVGRGKLRYFPSWQPISNDEVALKEPTPEPTETASQNGLIAFTFDQGGNAEIYTMHADGSNVTNLTNLSAHDVNPVWSPDGKHIAFESDRTGYVQIYTMNMDGSDLGQITDGEADHAIGTQYGNTPEPWSPDGKKIIFSQTVRGDSNNMLYVMDVDGSNKIALAGEPGLYTFLGWSSDGQKIVYQISNASDNGDTRIMVASIDGTSTFDGSFFEGDGGRTHHQIHWETSEQFITLSSNSERPTWGLWNLTRFYTTEADYINSVSSNPILVTSNSPIVAIFDRTYVVENQDSLSWFVYSGAPIPLAPWSFSNLCKTPTNPLAAETFHNISPDKQRDFVSLICPEGTTYFFLMNSDGTEIQQLDSSIAGQSQVNALTWSPDGKHVIVTTSKGSNTNSTNLFRFDIQEMLNNPSTKPIQLTTDGVWKYGVAWQPILNDEVVEEKPTQTPSDNRLLAFTSAKGGNLDIYTIRSDGSSLTNLTNNPARDANPVWSPDGTRIAFESDRDGGNPSQIFLMDADGSNTTQLTTDEGDHMLPLMLNGKSSLWSPDGSKLLYMRIGPSDEEWTLQSIDINNSGITSLGTGKVDINNISWSPDGRHIAFVRNDPKNTDDNKFIPQMLVVSADGTNRHEIVEAKYINSIFWEDDGHFVGIGFDGKGEQPQWSLYRFSTEGSAPRVLASHTSPIIAIFKDTYAVSDLGLLRWFAFQDDSSPLASWDFTAACDHPDSEPLTLNTDPTVSPDRKHFIVSVSCGETTQFYLENEHGSEIIKLGSSVVNPVHIEQLTWSPDGNFVVATISKEDESKKDLYLLDIQKMLKDPSTQPIQLTTDGALKYNAVWQPVSNNEVVEEKSTPEPTTIPSRDDLIAFTADNNNATNTNMDIYTIRLDGSNLANLTHDPAKDFNANDYNPAWSPDRKKIVFMSDRGGSTTGNTNLFVMNPDGSDLTQLTYNPGYDAFLSWSPNGEKIAYYSSSTAESNAKGQLIVMNADGSNKTVLTPRGYYYFRGWSPDGQKIVYVEPRFDGPSYKDSGIYVVDIDGKNRHEWFMSNINQIHWIDSSHFLGVVQTNTEPHAQWTLFWFSTDGSQVELTAHNAPIVAIFENTYVVEGQDGLTWFTLEGTSISSSSWNVAEKCEATGGSYVSTSLNISPDQRHALAIIYCKDATWYYLVNDDGSQIEQLGVPSSSSSVTLPNWSPDGSYISLFLTNRNNPAYEDLYLMDIQKIVNDTSATPLLLTSNVLAGLGTYEPLIASNDDQAKQTPEPLDFSLSVYEAEKLAFFDVLEPSYLPAGYALEGVAYDPWTERVAMKYSSQQGKGLLFINQQRGDLIHDPEVRASTTPVSIGGIEGEFIQGAWIYESPDTTIPTWEPNADSYSLTWRKGEFIFSINFIGGETITPLSLNELTAIAESLK